MRSAHDIISKLVQRVIVFFNRDITLSPAVRLYLFNKVYTAREDIYFITGKVFFYSGNTGKFIFVNVWITSDTVFIKQLRNAFR